jgi:hypothetical protein
MKAILRTICGCEKLIEVPRVLPSIEVPLPPPRLILKEWLDDPPKSVKIGVRRFEFQMQYGPNREPVYLETHTSYPE